MRPPVCGTGFAALVIATVLMALVTALLFFRDSGEATEGSAAVGTVPTVPAAVGEAPTVPATDPSAAVPPAGGANTVAPPAGGPTSTVPAGGPAPVPGRAVDQWSWRAGETMAVIGVRHDDTLNVRSKPGFGYPVLTQLDPMADDLVVTGNGWITPDNEWLVEVRAGGVTGWVAARYAAPLAATYDITTQVAGQPGELPEAATMEELGRLVAEAVGQPEDGRVGSPGDEGIPRSVMSAAPTSGDRPEVTYDVIGYADDSLLGHRLRVFATRSEGGDGFVLTAVEATALCSRGVQAGMCL